MKIKLFALAILTGILLAIAWPPFPLTALLFIAVVPLLLAEQQVIEQKFSAFFFGALLFTAFLLWHLVSHQWLFGLGKTTAISIILINCLILTCFLLPAHFMKRANHTKLGHLCFVAGWMSFDLLHLNWDLAYPLLNLGNGLARFPILIQWYEYTGAFGGSIWILGVNLLVFLLVQQYRNQDNAVWKSPQLKYLGLSLFLPIGLSLLLYTSFEENPRDTEVVVIHPNIDTRSERFIIDLKDVIDRYIKYSKEAITPETEYLLWSENTITDGQWVEFVDDMEWAKVIRDSFAAYPSTKIIIGSILHELFQNGKPKDMPADVTYSESLNQSYYTYSAAIQIDPSQKTILNRTKQQLVPIEESAPYPFLLSGLRKLIGNYTGLTFSPRKKNQHVFYSKKGITKITPLICYESAFGANTGQYVQKGAQALFVMLNEGWYRDWQGASQFLYFSVLRAIENRRSVARSSNDGISGFISPRGDFIELKEDFEPDALRQKISLHKDLTFYTRFGDYLGWLAFLVGLGSCVYFLSLKFFSKKPSTSPPARGKLKPTKKKKKK